VEGYIQLGVDEGPPNLSSNGRGFKLQGHEDGFFVGPTLFDHVQPAMKTYQDEIFGPVLQLVRAETLDEAIALPSRHAYGNGVSIFTPPPARARARNFTSRVQAGHGSASNVPIPRAAGLLQLRRLEALGLRRTPTSTAWTACGSTPSSRR